GRTTTLPRWECRCRYIRADPADGRASGSARTVCVHWWAFGGGCHGDCGNHRPVHHGLQRPGDARAPAPTLAALARTAGSLRSAAVDSPLGHRRHPIVRLRIFPRCGGGLRLVSIGLISFAAVAQFAPSIFGAIYWKEGTKNGAIAGLLAGFAVWG